MSVIPTRPPPASVEYTVIPSGLTEEISATASSETSELAWAGIVATRVKYGASPWLSPGAAMAGSTSAPVRPRAPQAARAPRRAATGREARDARGMGRPFCRIRRDARRVWARWAEEGSRGPGWWDVAHFITPR